MPEPDPEQLLKLLDAQRAFSRSRRADTDSRTAFRVWSLVLIIGITIFSLALLQWMLSRMVPSHGTNREPLIPAHESAR